MSTAEQHLSNNPLPPLDSDQFSGNTSVRSIVASQELKEYRPEDLRSRRFGYNPGWDLMAMPTHLSGMQTGRVEPGKLTLFETGPIMLQNWSVDAMDPGPPNLPGELLAGQQVINLMAWYENHGFRELEALRKMEDQEAIQIFSTVHPRLSLGIQQEIIAPCVYELDVCVTCREAYLGAIAKVVSTDTPFAATVERLVDSTTSGKAHMRNMWNTWVTEMAARRTPGGRGVGELTEDHLRIMRQLHQRTPNDQEFAKINASTEGLKEALENQAKMFTEILGKRDNEEARERELQTLREESAETRRLMLAQQAEFKEMLAQNKPAKDKSK